MKDPRPIATLERHQRLVVATLVLLVVLAGVAYSLVLGAKLRYPDEHEYLTLARNLVHSGEFSFGMGSTASRPPGYAFFLAGPLLFGAGVAVLRSANFVLLAITVYAVYRLGRRAGDSGLVGVLAAAGVALYPLLFYTAGTLYPQTLATLLLVLGLWAVTGPRSARRALLGGLLFGALILTVPTFAFSLGVVCVWLIATQRRAAIAPVVAVLVGAAVVVTPWTVRNAVVLGSPVFVATNSGVNLLLGNSEHARANSGTNVDISRYVRAANGRSEVDRDAYYRSQAFRWIHDHKLAAVKLYVSKVLNYFNFRNELRTRSQASTGKDLLLLLTYGPLLLLALARLAYARRRRMSSFEVLCLVLYFANALWAAVFFTRVRFRAPLDAILILIVAMFVGSRRRAPPERA